MRDTRAQAALAADLRAVAHAAGLLAAMVQREFAVLGDDGAVRLLDVGLRVLALRLAGIASRTERGP